MAPKRNVKEAVAAPQQVHAKKVKKDPVADKLNHQLRTITDAWKLSSVTDEVAKMLTEILPCSLGEYCDQRSKFQEQVVESVAGILAEVEASLNKVIDDARSHRDEATSGKPLREKEAEEATAKLEAAKVETQRLKVALANKALAFRGATASLAEAEEAKKLDAKKSQEAGKQKSHFETALEVLNVLKAISPEEPEAKKKQDELVACLEKYKFEESILIALPAALAKAPDARGMFDHMALGQLETELGKKIAEQDSILAAARPGQEKCEAAVRQAQEQLNSVRMEQRLAAKNFDAASKEQAACEEASVAAQKVVRDLTNTSKQLEKAVFAAEVELELFQQGPMEEFKALRNRATPAPVVEPVEEHIVAPVAEEEPASTDMPVEAEVPVVAAC